MLLKFPTFLLEGERERERESDSGGYLLPSTGISYGSKYALGIFYRSKYRAYATTAISKLFENLCLQSLALTKVSFNDFPLRYDSMSGS